MAYCFVSFAEKGAADYTVCGFNFKYLSLTEEDAGKIMATASDYKVQKEVIERYSHDDYGNYESVEEVIDYELTEMRSISEKIWDKSQSAGDIIVHEGEFLGVVFFTGFTDYRGLEEYGFIPLEHKDSREGLSRYCCVEFSILKRTGLALPQSTSSTTESYSDSGRSSTSYRTNYYLLKK